MPIVEADFFTRSVLALLDASEYRMPQSALVENPLLGAVMRDCGGMRKVRVSQSGRGKGKRGAVALFTCTFRKRSRKRSVKGDIKMPVAEKKSSIFGMLDSGLNESIEFSRGERTDLVQVQLPAPPPPMGAKVIIQIRERLQVPQSVFASYLNVSPKAVQSWEQGVRRPSGASLRLLQIACENPLVFSQLAKSQAKTTVRKSPRR